jgi:molybdate transport system regulatory protein
MKVSYKIWLDHHGKAFGDGPYELLKGVEKTKSLHRAAQQMGMAYSKAWRLLGMLEERLGFPLLERRTGGPSGGGSRVTPAAKEFMERYGRFQKETRESLEKVYRKHFGSGPPPVLLLKGKKAKRSSGAPLRAPSQGGHSGPPLPNPLTSRRRTAK